MPKNECFNVLVTLAHGVAVRRVDGGAWNVMLPPVRPDSSTAVSEAALAELTESGWVDVNSDVLHISDEGRRALDLTLTDAIEVR